MELIELQEPLVKIEVPEPLVKIEALDLQVLEELQVLLVLQRPEPLVKIEVPEPLVKIDSLELRELMALQHLLQLLVHLEHLVLNEHLDYPGLMGHLETVVLVVLEPPPQVELMV
jgi:hypothetical protein